MPARGHLWARTPTLPTFTKALLRWGRWPFRTLKLVRAQQQVSLSLPVKAPGIWKIFGRVWGRQFADFASFGKPSDKPNSPC
jgi:hypothetical protein